MNSISSNVANAPKVSSAVSKLRAWISSRMALATTKPAVRMPWRMDRRSVSSRDRGEVTKAQREAIDDRGAGQRERQEEQDQENDDGERRGRLHGVHQDADGHPGDERRGKLHPWPEAILNTEGTPQALTGHRGAAAPLGATTAPPSERATATLLPASRFSHWV